MKVKVGIDWLISGNESESEREYWFVSGKESEWIDLSLGTKVKVGIDWLINGKVRNICWSVGKKVKVENIRLSVKVEKERESRILVLKY